jgi:foldase protein PrsA
MPRFLRVSLALCAVFFVSILSACGSGVPGDSAAKVDNVTISNQAFDRWANIAARSGAGQGGGAGVPDAPNFTKCIAAAKLTQPKLPKGTPAPTDAQYKQQCQTKYTQLLQQTATFLIRSTWLDKEADRQGVKVSDKDVVTEFDKARVAAFPKAADFLAFMKSSGSQLADLQFRQRTQILQQKITEKITKGIKPPTDKELQAYYEKNRAQFGTPESRTLQVILNSDKAKAAAGLAAVKSGQSWSSATKKYSNDPTTKDSGGVLRDVQKGQGEKTFDDAVFKAKKGQIIGPIKTSSGYYVFRVTNVTPEDIQPFSKVKPQLQSQLASENQQKTLTKFGAEYSKRWKKKTECSKKALVQDCNNYKAPKATTQTPTATAVPSTQTTTTK